MSEQSIETWLKSARYLPKSMRDFHDQKAIFKAMHETVNVKCHHFAGNVDWVSGQCYVIDIFLWWMARRGYTLQRTRKRLPFRDLASDVKAAEESRRASLNALIQQKGPR